MGKRSDFPRIPQDKYDTPFNAVAPLLPYLTHGTRFIEPCVGNGFLVGHLKRAGHILVGAFDLPDDARSKGYDIKGADVFITNPPWARPTLHQVIANLSNQLPTWLLIDYDWLCTRQSAPYLPRLRVIVCVGRVKWIPGSPFTGKDNCCWCLFDRPQPDGQRVFVGRDDSVRKAA